MYKFSKIQGNVKAKMPDIVNYLSSVSQLIAAYLFGSYAKERQDQMSDIDIALLFRNEFSTEQMNKLELSIWQKLTAILRTDEIDLLVLNHVPLSMQFEIIRTGKTICNNDNDRRIDFEIHTCARYWDFKKLKDEYDSYSIRRLKHKYLEDSVHELK
ncbi:MAG TPA: nucleotidyltransferase domain-containing protein [bacterium]